MKAKVSERGQVTIPKALRDRLGIRPGTVLDFREEEGLLVAEKEDSGDVIDQVYGMMGRCRRTAAVMRELRDEP